MFAIYPWVDQASVRDHAVIFVEDADVAEKLAEWFTDHYGTRHEAFLVMPSWPDAKLIHSLNGCPGDVWFSTRVPQSAHDASNTVREILRRLGLLN